MKKLLKKLNKKLTKKLDQGRVYIQDQVFYLKSLNFQVLPRSLQGLKILLVTILLTAATLFSGQLHLKYLESKVGDNVVFIRNPDGAKFKGSATGFEIVAPSGKVYTLTNAHVCELAKDGIILVQEKRNSNRLIPRRVIEVYAENDLCLVEGLEGYSGLKMASDMEVGDIVWAIGYPMGQGMNISTGRVKEFGQIQIVEEELTSSECKGPHRKMKPYLGLFEPIQVCVIERYSALTDVPTFPGNSGSPLVNIYGNVKGVVFASDNETHWGIVVPLDEVNKFIAAY